MSVAILSAIAEKGFWTGPWPGLETWRAAALRRVQDRLSDPVERERWLRHGGTWFAGVGSLGADPTGAPAGGPSLPEDLPRLCAEVVGAPFPFDPGQLSITFPGYPLRDPGESEAAARFRRRRDAAHVDGLLPHGVDRRRHMSEPHAFVLGIPLTHAEATAAPLVVWEGSHALIRAAFARRLAGIAPEDWAGEDLTEVYHDVRRTCFEACPRRIVPTTPGEIVLLHRLMLHGVAPWEDGARAEHDMRAIAYFRPALPTSVNWLREPPDRPDA
ncbi:MAG: hypothetical protein ACU0CI_07570, partial [Shimia sp.]